MCWLKRIDKTPEGEELDHKRLVKHINAIKAQKRGGPCHIEALRRVYYYQKQGIPYKLCRGTYNGDGHVWAEYYSNGKWLIDDPAQGIKGWERDKVRRYSQDVLETVPDYRKEA